MKKIPCIILTSLFSFSLFSQTWDYVGQSRFTNEIFANTFNMTVTKDGKPIIYYKDDRQSNRAKARIFDGSNWVAFGASVGFGPGSEQQLNIETDNENNIILTYEKVRGAAFKYTDQITTLGGGSGVFSPGNTNFLDLSISPNSNEPYVVFADEPNGNKATVKHYSYTTRRWETVGNFAFTANRTEYTAIAVDSKETPYVVFKDWANGRKISVMKFDGTSWVYVGDSGFDDVLTKYTSIAINSNDEVFVAYTNNHTSGKVKKFNGTNWVSVGNTDTFTEARVSFVDLKIAKNDVPYVAFQDGANDGKTSVKRLVNNTWENVGEAGFSDGYANVLSLHFDDNDHLYLGFSEAGDNGFRASVMKFDTSTLSTENQNQSKTALTLYPNPSSNFLSIKTQESIKEIKVYDVLGYLQMIQKDSNLDISSLANGVYFVAIALENKNTIVRKIQKI